MRRNRLTPGRLLVAAFALVVPGFAVSALHADDWPQWLGPQRDGVWRESGILEKFPPGGPKVRWRAPVGGGYAGPAGAGGKGFLTHPALPSGAADPNDPVPETNPRGQERVLCLGEKTGKG